MTLINAIRSASRPNWMSVVLRTSFDIPFVLKTSHWMKSNYRSNEQSEVDLLFVMSYTTIMSKQKRKYPRTLKKTPEQIAQEHMHCRMELLQKGPHMGLYCGEHGTWIQWIGKYQAKQIKDIL